MEENRNLNDPFRQDYSEKRINKDRNPISKSKFLNTSNQRQEKTSGEDRAAKTDRKGAAREQDAGSGPVHS